MNITQRVMSDQRLFSVRIRLIDACNAPRQLTTIAHTQNGDTTATFDGREGWLASVDKPVRLLPLLPGSELDGAKIDADLWFPGGIKQALTDWRTGFPIATIEDKEVTIIQGTTAGKSRIKLFFDNETGLLVYATATRWSALFRYKSTIRITARSPE